MKIKTSLLIAAVLAMSNSLGATPRGNIFDPIDPKNEPPAKSNPPTKAEPPANPPAKIEPKTEPKNETVVTVTTQIDSVLFKNAISKYDNSISKAEEEYNKALIAAKKIAITELDVAIKASMQKGNLDEANYINGIKKKLQAEVINLENKIKDIDDGDFKVRPIGSYKEALEGYVGNTNVLNEESISGKNISAVRVIVNETSVCLITAIYLGSDGVSQNGRTHGARHGVIKQSLLKPPAGYSIGGIIVSQMKIQHKGVAGLALVYVPISDKTLPVLESQWVGTVGEEKKIILTKDAAPATTLLIKSAQAIDAIGIK